MLIFKNSDNFKVYIQFALELLFSWVSLGTVAGGGIAGNPREDRPPELEEHCRAGPAGGAPRQTPCCESPTAQGWAEAVAFTSFFQFSDCIWVQTGGFL